MGLANARDIDFWYDKWIDESPLINKILSNIEEFITSQAKVYEFITISGERNLVLIIFNQRWSWKRFKRSLFLLIILMIK